LNEDYGSFVKNGSWENGIITGYCQGTRQLTYSPTYVGTTLNNVAALIANNSEIDTIPASSSAFCKAFYGFNGSQVAQIYYDPVTILPISSGSSPAGYVYSNQIPLPTSVTAGSSGTMFTYQDFRGTPSPITSGVLTWVVTADTASTLLFTTTDTSRLTSNGALVYKSITTYRINANNTLLDLYKNIQPTNIATQGEGDQNVYETYYY